MTTDTPTIEKLQQARSDACAINATYGLLATFVAATEREAELGQLMLHRDLEDVAAMGQEWIERSAAILDEVRKKIDDILQSFGDHQNAHDSVSGYMLPVSKPVYEIMRQRSAGQILDM